MSGPRIELRPGVREPVVLMLSRREVQVGDVRPTVERLNGLFGTREAIWRYRGQMSLVVDGYNDDPRELVEIPEVCSFLRALDAQWPYWAFFLNQVDQSIVVLAACLCGGRSGSGGTAEIDPERLRRFLFRGFAAMSAIFDDHGFPDNELKAMSGGVLEVFEQAGLGQ